MALATLGVVALPSRLVESAIAASVVLAALNNVWPVFHGRRWLVAFGFGLIHGFGFASVLADLGLPQGALAAGAGGLQPRRRGRPAGHRRGVPAAGLWSARARWLYRRLMLVGGSLLIAALATLWFAQRAFNLELLPF